MEDLRRHYIPYIDLCRLRGKTRRRPMVGRDTFHVLAGVNKSSIRLVATREFPEENRELTQQLPAKPFAIYFLQPALEEFSTVFTAVERFFTLPRQRKLSTNQIENPCYARNLTEFLRKLLAKSQSLGSFIWSSLLWFFSRSPNRVGKNRDILQRNDD